MSKATLIVLTIKVVVIMLLVLGAIARADARTVVREWNPQDLVKWDGGKIKDKRVENGALMMTTEIGDSQLVSPVFESVAATPWQRLEIEMTSDIAGRIVVFWTGTTAGPFNGFSSPKTTSFVMTEGKSLTYTAEPYWQSEKKIIRLRLDFPEQYVGHYAIRAVRIVEDDPGAQTTLPVRNATLDASGIWRARVNHPATDGSFLSIRMSGTAKKGSVGAASFVSDAAAGLNRVTFPLRPDGRPHTYNVDLGSSSNWRGNIIELRLEPGVKNAKVESILLGMDPQGPPDLEVTYLGLSDAIARSGKPIVLEALVQNHGGSPARGLKPVLKLTGARLLKAAPVPATVENGIPATLSWTVKADRPGTARAVLTLPGALPAAASLDFRAPVNLPKASYVPVPKPARTDYEIGVYYFPGWHTADRWGRIKPFPERKPLLGWYQEGSPEVADWQIKWAVEHGINFFLYDWYWDRGSRHLEHGIHDALFNARYQNMIEFCLLYANHNGAGSHSYEDFEQMTKFWIDNYFKRPNYKKIDGKPVVVFFSPGNPVRDMGGPDKVKAAFERMRAMCREAGLAGLYLVACTNTEPSRLAAIEASGYDAVSAYNWPGVNMTPAETAARYAPYSTGIEGYRQAWEAIEAATSIPLIPPINAGWDARPWAGDKALVRYGRTPELFKRHLIDAKKLIDKRGKSPAERMIFIEAWNELGEGSYIEPHREFGFGYLEAIRQVFAPNSPKPSQIVPADIGLGPYDIAETPPASAWDFTKAKNPLGWNGSVTNMRVEGGELRFTTRGTDPVLSSPQITLRANRYPVLALRMKTSQDMALQVFWATTSSVISEANSTVHEVKGDGQWHDVRLNLGDHPRWRGLIKALRVDPGGKDGVDVAIQYIRLEEAKP